MDNPRGSRSTGGHGARSRHRAQQSRSAALQGTLAPSPDPVLCAGGRPGPKTAARTPEEVVR